MSYAENAEAIQWFDRYVEEKIISILTSMGMPGFLLSGVVKTTKLTNGVVTSVDIYLNGSTTASTNIPVSPDVAANIAAGTPVWVMAVNFNKKDLFVLCRKIA